MISKYWYFCTEIRVTLCWATLINRCCFLLFSCGYGIAKFFTLGKRFVFRYKAATALVSFLFSSACVWHSLILHPWQATKQQSNKDLASLVFLKVFKFKIEVPESVCVCVCLSICVSLASDSSETIEVIIIKFGMVTASDMEMHYVLIILTLTFIQGQRF